MTGRELIIYILSNNLENETVGTNRKRHITGGVLLSLSLLFGNLAITVMSLKTEIKKHE